MIGIYNILGIFLINVILGFDGTKGLASSGSVDWHACCQSGQAVAESLATLARELTPQWFLMESYLHIPQQETGDLNFSLQNVSMVVANYFQKSLAKQIDNASNARQRGWPARYYHIFN